MRHASILLAMTCIPAAALAQAGPVEQPAPPPSPPSAATSDASTGEIIVTAQRRAENLQKSSLAIQVLSGAQLAKAGLSQPGELTQLVPGLQLAVIGSTAQPFIRGVGNASNTGAADSGVAFNVDGVYIAQVIAYGLDFYDIARTEVLKGPQGTLYGRNATGGAVNLITNQPGKEFGGYFSQDFGNYGLIHSTGAINVPITDNLAVRGAFNVVRRHGYYHDGSGDDKQQEGRIRIKWTPGSRVTALLNLEYGHAGGVGAAGAVDDGTASGGQDYHLVRPWAGQLDPYIVAHYNIAKDKTQDQFQDVKSYMVSSEINVDLGSDTTFTFLPAYRHVTQSETSYSQQFLFQPFGFRYDQTTLEARLGHNASNWKWVIGAYYFHHNQNTPFNVDEQIFPIGFFGPADPFLGHGVDLRVDPTRQNVNSYSVFGETTYSLTDRLRVIGGIRYTKEKTRGSGVQTFFEKPVDICSDAAPCVIPYASRVSSSNVSWKGGFEYDLAPSSLLFGTASTGFKAGGVFPANPPRNTFKPEKLLAFELGSRNRFFDNKVQLNVEGFYWKYKDKQETIAGYDGCGSPTCGGTLTNLTVNSGKATLYGASVDLLLRPTPADTLHFGGEYNHSEYTTFNFFSPNPVNSGCAQGPGSSGGTPGFIVDCSGFPLTRAPRWTGSADYQHVFALGHGDDITFAASASYTSSRYLDAHFLGMLKAPGYVIGNFDVTYNAPRQRWSITGYIKNVAKVAAPTTGYSLADTLTDPFIAAVILNPPRTFGVRANVKF